MLQAIIKDRGGPIETYFSGAPGTTTVSVYTGDGATKVDAATCTVDGTATELTSAVDAGDDEITVNDASDMVVGRRYKLGESTETAEVFAVKAISGTLITLWAPLQHAHVIAADVVGLRAAYSVLAANADVYWWDGYAVFTPTTGEPQTEAVDCVRRKIPDVLIGEADIRAVIPKVQKALSEETDLQAAYREARDQLLIDMGGKNRAHTILGVDHLRRPCALKFWLLRRHEFGDEWSDAMDKLQAELDRLLDKLIGQAAVDADQDGATTGRDDGGFTMVQVERA